MIGQSNGLVLFDEENLPIFEQESYEEHTSAWITVDQSIEGHRWALGAVAASLTKRYGDDIVGKFASDVQSSKARIWSYAQTYRAFKNSTRVEFLSFRHHTIASRTDDPAQTIELASEYELSTRELDHMVHTGELPVRHLPDSRREITSDGNGDTEVAPPEILQIEPLARDAKTMSRQELEDIAAESERKRVQRKKKELDRDAKLSENRRLIETTRSESRRPEPGATFSTIVLDPPWDWGDEGDHDQLGRAKPTYGTMGIDEIAALPVSGLAKDNAHIYLWITNRSLPKGFRLLEEWGFRYITAITWVKPHFGQGNYFRGSTEHLLFGIRGSLPLLRGDARTDFRAGRGSGGHSSKPPEAYDLIETASPGPWLEMFARNERPGWKVWGAEV